MTAPTAPALPAGCFTDPARPLSVPTAAQCSDAVSGGRPCYLSDQLSVRT
jgi:hypothetical protein